MTIFWIGFLLLVFFLLALDLGVFHKKEHEIKAKEALRWTAFWVSCALLFGVFVYFVFGSKSAMNYLTGYLVEQSLSLDNIFVIALIIKSFNIPKEKQHRVLFWGILGALAMRGTMIILGAALIVKFHAILYFFGVFLIFIALKMAFTKETKEEFNPDKSLIIKCLRKIYPKAPPFLAAIIVIEFSDLIFAVDSIPAIFAITTDPFIVFTSNIFAILGLRSLYFAIDALMGKFTYLKYSLVCILGFVGIKMLMPLFCEWNMPEYFSLVVILFFLLCGILASKFAIRKL